jgi:DNA-binding PadR family transcriptional regulator
MSDDNLKAVQREILLSFWKIHILFHGAAGPVVGQWMLKELRHHGYDVSPGTLYPILHRMERLGWLRSETGASGGLRARRSFYTTELGKEVLAIALRQLNEVRGETMITGCQNPYSEE